MNQINKYSYVKSHWYQLFQPTLNLKTKGRMNFIGSCNLAIFFHLWVSSNENKSKFVDSCRIIKKITLFLKSMLKLQMRMDEKLKRNYEVLFDDILFIKFYFT